MEKGMRMEKTRKERLVPLKRAAAACSRSRCFGSPPPLWPASVDCSFCSSSATASLPKSAVEVVVVTTMVIMMTTCQSPKRNVSEDINSSSSSWSNFNSNSSKVNSSASSRRLPAGAWALQAPEVVAVAPRSPPWPPFPPPLLCPSPRPPRRC
mgnify:CR=1 FL=1